MTKQFILLFVFSIFTSNYILAQNGNEKTFTIETLKRPDSLLRELNSNEVIDKFAPQELAHTQLPEKVVYTGAHPFFDGMYKAYSDHRPFVISPDMIWLLICQGFSHHVNNNAEALRSMFVNFDGKKSLVVKMDNSQPLTDISTWENIIPQFVQQIADNTGEELMTNLTADFSTTTSTEKIATQITAMEAMHPYFEYVVLRVMCGIPEITIKGTPQDWQALKDKTDALRKYKLDWWIDELDPVLDQFINASNGKFHKRFWRNMFKYHTEKIYGAPKVIDGWIIKFYPYDKKGKRNDFKMLSSSEDIPSEQAVVDFSRINIYPDGHTENSPMQFIAGFFGLKQNNKTQALEPQIGWLVTPFENKINAKGIENNISSQGALRIRVSKVPEEILNLKAIQNLEIEFIDSVKIPARLSLGDIGSLSLTGNISEEETKKIYLLFPYSVIRLFNKDGNFITPKNITHLDSANLSDDFSYTYSIDKISSDHWKNVSLFSFSKSVKLPDEFSKVKIDRMEIQCDDITEDNKQQIIKAFPNTYLIINDTTVQNPQYLNVPDERKEKYDQWIQEHNE